MNYKANTINNIKVVVTDHDEEEEEENQKISFRRNYKRSMSTPNANLFLLAQVS